MYAWESCTELGSFGCLGEVKKKQTFKKWASASKRHQSACGLTSDQPARGLTLDRCAYYARTLSRTYYTARVGAVWSWGKGTREGTQNHVEVDRGLFYYDLGLGGFPASDSKAPTSIQYAQQVELPRRAWDDIELRNTGDWPKREKHAPHINYQG